MSEPAYATGGNYEVSLAGGVAVCRVWRRPDVDAQTGAGWAAEKVELVQRLVREPRAVVRGFILDLREAPFVVGPKTQAFLGAMLAPWEEGARQVAVVGGQSPTQGLQLSRVIAQHAPQTGRLVPTMEEALDWVSQGRSQPPSGRRSRPVR